MTYLIKHIYTGKIESGKIEIMIQKNREKNRKSSDRNQENLGPGKNQKSSSPWSQKIKNFKNKKLFFCKKDQIGLPSVKKPFRENPTVTA